jgi:hypothetical protein
MGFYEAAHRNAANRFIHHVGHAIAVIGIVAAPWHPANGAGLILIAFLLSWTGHFVFERNTPAFFEPAANHSVSGSGIKKIQVALGGLVWSGACLLRLFGLGPLAARR